VDPRLAKLFGDDEESEKKRDPKKDLPEGDQQTASFGLAFIRAESGAELTLFWRYETAIARQFHKTIGELQRLQALRMGGASLPPIAVDVELSSGS